MKKQMVQVRNKRIKEVIEVTKRPYHPDYSYREPELTEDLHRPPGSPHPREAKSQKAQLNSKHRHGTNKGVKVGMSEKTGLTDE